MSILTKLVNDTYKRLNNIDKYTVLELSRPLVKKEDIERLIFFLNTVDYFDNDQDLGETIDELIAYDFIVPTILNWCKENDITQDELGTETFDLKVPFEELIIKHTESVLLEHFGLDIRNQIMLELPGSVYSLDSTLKEKIQKRLEKEVSFNELDIEKDLDFSTRYVLSNLKIIKL